MYNVQLYITTENVQNVQRVINIFIKIIFKDKNNVQKSSIPSATILNIGTVDAITLSSKSSKYGSQHYQFRTTLMFKDHNIRKEFFFKIQGKASDTDITSLSERIHQANNRINYVHFFANKSTKDYFILITVKQGQQGLSKDYFKSSRYKGYSAMQALPVPWIQLGFREIKKLLKQRNELENLLDEQIYLDKAIDLILKNDEKERYSKSDESNRSSKEEIIAEAIQLHRDGLVENFGDLYTLNQGDLKKQIDIMNNEPVITKHYKYQNKLKDLQENHHDNKEQLMQYMERNTSLKGQYQQITDQNLESCGLLQALDALYRVIFRKCHQKMNGVWLWGDSDTGKSTLISMVEKIFRTEKFIDAGSQFKIDMSTPLHIPSIVTMNEINYHHFFSKSNMPAMKLLLEGNGYPFNAKFMEPEVRYKGCQVIMSSNQIPFEHMATRDKDAFMSRVLLVEMIRKMRDNSQGFPFSTYQMADYFQRRLITDGDMPHAVGDETQMEKNSSDEDYHNYEETKENTVVKEAEEHDW